MSDGQLELFGLLRRYSALSPIQTQSFPTHFPFSLIQTFLLDSVLLNPHLKTYPPSKHYQQTFWKWATFHLETMPKDEDDEIDTRIYDHYLSLLVSSTPEPNNPLSMCGPPIESYVTHYWKLPQLGKIAVNRETCDAYQTTTLLESQTTIEGGTTGLRTWRASLVLSQYLISCPTLATNKIVLELGCGTGFLGIIVASLQQQLCDASKTPGTHSSVWLTDVNEDVLSRCRDNLRLQCNRSSSHPSVHYRTLNWSDALDSLAAPHLLSLLRDIDADIIVGSDLVFDPLLVPSLIAVLMLALNHDQSGNLKGRMAIIALTVRNNDTLSVFLHEAKKKLHVEEMNVSFDTNMFIGMSEGGIDNNQDVKIFKLW